MTSAIQINQYGGSEVLTWVDVEIGQPAKGQVRLKQVTSGLNFIDVYHRTGFYDLPLPLIPGVEGAGIVVAVGEGVTNFKIIAPPDNLCLGSYNMLNL